MTAQQIFVQEIKLRLKQIQSPERRVLPWPEGCYGSAVSWLMFVGPSPGGKPKVLKIDRRAPDGGKRLWNVEFTEPYSKRPKGWGRKYRENMPVLITTIMGRSLKRGAGKLYGFANFDWVSSPQESMVSQRRMKKGEKDVVGILKSCQPRVIVPLTQGSYARLVNCFIREGYQLFKPLERKVRIRIDPAGKAYHKTIDAVKLIGRGVLAGSVVIRLPQHPARMLYGGHGKRCAKAVRKAAIQIFQQKKKLVISEV